MRKPLYWSHVVNYKSCPQKYLWYKGHPEIDLGAGLGKPKPKPKKSSEHHAIMGDVIQYAVEKFYNDEFWRQPDTALSLMKRLVVTEMNRQMTQRYIDMRKAPSRDEMLAVCESGVVGFLRTLKAHRLIGPYARSEVNMVGSLDTHNSVAGRADIIIKREDTGITILDGKNSKYRDKYLDPDQLKWYALCYYLLHGEIPDRLGFLPWRFPHGFIHEDGTVDEGVVWVDFDPEVDLIRLAQTAHSISDAIADKKFEATPSGKNCKFCDFETVCLQRREQLAANAKSKEDTLDAVVGDSGLVDFTFEDT